MGENLIRGYMNSDTADREQILLNAALCAHAWFAGHGDDRDCGSDTQPVRDRLAIALDSYGLSIPGDRLCILPTGNRFE